jgi:hypothetical protein
MGSGTVYAGGFRFDRTLQPLDGHQTRKAVS